MVRSTDEDAAILNSLESGLYVLTEVVQWKRYGSENMTLDELVGWYDCMIRRVVIAMREAEAREKADGG